MATSIMTTIGKTQRAYDFYQKASIYIGIGQTTAWSVETSPDAILESEEEINELVAIKVISTKKYVRAQTGGEIVFNGSEWTEVYAAEQTYTASTISFDTTGDTIDDSANSLPVFAVGHKIKVIGATNEGYYTVVTSTTAQIAVAENLTTQAAGTAYTVKSNIYTNDVSRIYYEGIFDYDNGTPDALPVDITYRQIGLLENPINSAEAICTGDVYLAASLSGTAEYPQGVLHYVDNRTPVTRSDSQRESLQLILEF